MKRKKWKLLIVSFVLIVAVFWSVENYTVRVNSVNLVNSKVNGQIKIVLVSDLHSVRFGKDNKNLKGLIEVQEPDLIFVLGDMYSYNDNPQTAISFTTALTGYAPVYFVSGDHDYSENYFKKLEDGGVNVLNFEKSDITVGQNEISVYGIRSEWFSDTFDLNNAFGPADKSRLNILLAHIPLAEKFESYENLDFIFAADTHGGMLRLPVIGPAYYQGSIFPKFSYDGEMYDKGLFNLGDRQLFVTSGLGDYPLPVRFNNRPEIVSITLKGE